MTKNPKNQTNPLAKGVKITYSIKHLPCSNPSCLTCLAGKGHGPYWYAQYELEGQKKNVFLGRKFKPLDLTKVIQSNLKEHPLTEEAAPLETPEPIVTEAKASEAPKAKPATTKAHKAEAAPAKKPIPSYHRERVGRSTHGLKSFTEMPDLTKKKAEPKKEVKAMPSLMDFEQDIKLLKGAARSHNLKWVYRKLIKKYHPDQFGGNPRMDRWMSTINGEYHQLLQSSRA